MHLQSVTVWCEISSIGVIGRFFFGNEEGNVITVYGVRYWVMLTDFLGLQLDQINIKNSSFEQEGATAHILTETIIILLRERFQDRHISLWGDQVFPLRSCDLTPREFLFFVGVFYGGYVKSQIYGNKPRNLTELKHEIQLVLCQIDQNVYMIESRWISWPQWLRVGLVWEDICSIIFYI